MCRVSIWLCVQIHRARGDMHTASVSGQSVTGVLLRSPLWNLFCYARAPVRRQARRVVTTDRGGFGRCPCRYCGGSVRQGGGGGMCVYGLNLTYSDYCILVCRPSAPCSTNVVGRWWVRTLCSRRLLRWYSWPTIVFSRRESKRVASDCIHGLWLSALYLIQNLPIVKIDIYVFSSIVNDTYMYVYRHIRICSRGLPPPTMHTRMIGYWICIISIRILNTIAVLFKYFVCSSTTSTRSPRVMLMAGWFIDYWIQSVLYNVDFWWVGFRFQNNIDCTMIKGAYMYSENSTA